MTASMGAELVKARLNGFLSYFHSLPLPQFSNQLGDTLFRSSSLFFPSRSLSALSEDTLASETATATAKRATDIVNAFSVLQLSSFQFLTCLSPTRMGDSRDIDVKKIISYSDDLVKVLKEKRDINSLTQCLEQSKTLCSSCDADFNEVRFLLEDYQKKIDICKQKTEETRSQVAADEELDLLERELEEELEKERLLGEELRVISNEFNDLERQWLSVQEQKRTLQKPEQDELRAQMRLSMYASVTNIIPNLYDQSKISGYMVDREKEEFEKFEFDPSKMTSLDVCNDIWKMWR